MELTVYADVLFALNFVINMILLSITAHLSKIRACAMRKSISSAIGAAYAVIMFVPQFACTDSLILKFILSSVMISVAFGVKNIKLYFKLLSVFYMVTLMSGGCSLAFAYFSSEQSSPFVVNNGVVYFDTNLGAIVLSSLCCLLVMKLSGSLYKRYSLRAFHRLVIYKDGKAATLSVMLDTGNMLTDPLTGHPVIIAEKSALKGIVPMSVDLSDPIAMSQHINGVRLIPFKSLGCENGLLAGFKPDKVCADCDISENITIAIASGSLSKSGEYNALAGPESFEK